MFFAWVVMLATSLLLNKLSRTQGFCGTSWIKRFSGTLKTGDRRLASLDERNFYITTPIYYVNGNPHLGHAYTSVISDVIARYKKQTGHNVFYLTGTDEHGQKVEQSAKAANVSPIAFADTISKKFRDLANELNCCNNDFIRTTESRHKIAAQAFWKKLEENNQIYLSHYEGWYSVRDESFYDDAELVNGKAPTGASVEWVREESYFFRLSEWTKPLLEFYEKHPDFISPVSKRNEVIAFLSQEGGLHDISVSRTTFKWGIPVPGNETHVMYVWLDALVNYISALGYPNCDEKSLYESFWPASLQIVGKDILRFHAIYWPAFLMAAGLAPPKRIFAHGWWTKDGQKMSKSLGNVLDPFEIIRNYGVDFFRYFLVSEVPFGCDGNFSDQCFVARVNGDLTNEVGNLVQRVLVLINKNCDGKIPVPNDFTQYDNEMLNYYNTISEDIRQSMEELDIKYALNLILSISRHANKYIDAQAPWKLCKEDKNRMNTVLFVLVEAIRQVAILLAPVIPSSSENILNQIGATADFRTFASLDSRIASGTTLGRLSHIFPRLDKVDPCTVCKEVAAEPKKVKKTVVDPKLIREFSQYSLPELNDLIKQTGDIIRHKKEKEVMTSMDKIEMRDFVDKLLALKECHRVLSEDQTQKNVSI